MKVSRGLGGDVIPWRPSERCGGSCPAGGRPAGRSPAARGGVMTSGEGQRTQEICVFIYTHM